MTNERLHSILRSGLRAGLYSAALLGLAVAIHSPRTALAEMSDSAAFSSDQKKAIEQIVKDYLVNNPEVLQDAMAALEAKNEKAQAEKMKVAISENAADIFRRSTGPVAGNPKGDVTVVEFFDYNCGYCKKSIAEVVKLIEKDPQVRVAFKEFPILSKGSEEASRVALAARIQGKYWELHRTMLESKGPINEAAALKFAEKLGLDMSKLKKDMASEDVKAELENSKALAQKMGINGTPHFLVGDRSIPGAPENLFEQLNTNVADLRKNGCSSC